MNTIYFLTHPIQYQTPLLKALVGAGEPLKVLYASTTTTWEEDDWKRRVPLVWDIPLLEGYPYDSFDDAGAQGGFWHQVGHYRKVIRGWLKQNPAQTAWVHGWGNPYALAALLEVRKAGITTFIRGESHLDGLRGPAWRKLAHRILLGWLFRRIEGFLAIGSANKRFYEAYGVAPNRITLMPYVVDNVFFQRPPQVSASGLPFLPNAGRPVVLFVGKLATHKAVDTLIEGVAQASRSMAAPSRPRLIIVGEGDKRSELEALAERLLPGDVWFAGFRNQTEMPAFYEMADVFVLPSRFEPWGLVVNEAMNAKLPIVVSDMVGARHDLVVQGINGSIFPAGDSIALAESLMPLLSNPGLRQRFGQSSLEIISHWGIPEAVLGWKKATSTRHQPPVARLAGSERDEGRASPVFPSPRFKLSISYAYVHNAYQQAQAAADTGNLENFYCSCLDADGQWGRWIGRLAGREAMASRGGVNLPPHAVVEHPWPLLRGRLSERLSGVQHHDWLAVSAEFDRWVAPRLEQDPCELLLCYETGAQESFIKARDLGKHCLLDCPQFHPDFLWNLLAEAAERCALPPPPPIDTPETASRKRNEFALAHDLLVYSPLHATSFIQAGFKEEHIQIAPLWIDPSLWYPVPGGRRDKSKTLKLLFVGGASLRKGIPFLLEAMAGCGPNVHLTIAGEIDEAIKPIVARHQDYCTFVGPQTKPALRKIYAEHDLLVLPSVADAFGFVALEAMACGIPVLVSANCGVPVPSASWRVPAMDVAALEEHLIHRLKNPELLREDGRLALTFSRDFTTHQFRARMSECYQTLLRASS